MEDRGGEHGAGVAFGHALDQVIQRAGAAGGDHGHVDRIGHGAGQGDVVAGLDPVVVHRGQKDLSRAFFDHGAGEIDGVDAGGAPAAVGEDLPPAGGDGLGVDGDDDALRPEAQRGFGHDVGVGDGGGVEADLVGPGQQQGAHVVVRPHAAADGQRHETRLCRAGGEVEHGAAVFLGRHDVEKAKLVRAGGIVGDGGVHRIARIAQVDEVDALDHAAIGDVEAGDDAGLQHGPLIPREGPQGKGGTPGRVTGLDPCTNGRAR